jgi:putative ABC transport system ATP-binding protein
MSEVSIHNLNYSYPGSSENIHYPDWSVEKGKHALILGNSGSGKTTLLHLLGGLTRPSSGSVQVGGAELTRLSEDQLDKFRGKRLGLVFQKPHLIQSLSVKENLKAAAYFGRKSITSDTIESLAARLSIEEILRRRVYEISQGQAQRVAIARAVVNQPELILADEPTASLDDESCQRVLDLLFQESDRLGATLVIATHDQRVKTQIKHQLIL